MKVSRKKIDRKSPWLETGLTILTRKGPACLSIGELSRSMGKTKGAYYHHFRNKGYYIEALMTHYLKKSTNDIIRKTGAASTPKESLKMLLANVLSISEKTELAIRAWALYDPTVKKYQDRIDRSRINHIKNQYYRVCKDRKTAYSTAIRLYSAYIGFQQLKDKTAKSIMRELIREVFRAPL